MKLGSSCKLALQTLKIRTRILRPTGWNSISGFHEVRLDDQPIFHSSADVALLKNPVFVSMPTDFAVSCFQYDDLADKSWLQNNLHAMDMASFIGFPGKNGKPWYDEQWNLAIARTVNIASLPAVGYSNSQVPTTDTMLASGLSFSGSSGSAVVSHEKGIKLGEGLSGGNYFQPKLIGIMSGHWWGEDKPDVFQHSGLSYLTSSAAIISLMNA